MPNETRQVRYGFAQQSVFGTGIADGAAFIELSVEDFDVDRDVIVHELPMNHGTRQPVEQSTLHSIQGSAGKFPLNGPLDVSYVDHIIYAHTQKVVELADTEFTKTFTFFSTHPIFTSNQGHFMTVIKRMPDASTSEKIHSAICSRFKISGERDGMIMFESDWVGKGTANDLSNPSGTWTPTDGQDIIEFNDAVSATLTRGAGLTSPASLTLQSFEIESVWEFDKIGQDSVGGFQSFGIKNRSGSFKLQILRDSVTDEAIESLKEGEMVQFDLDLGRFTAKITGKIELVEDSRDGVLYSTITGKMLAEWNGATAGECLQYVVQNDIDRNW